ncbi:MAG: DUF1905 domain-containing protein [Sphingomonadaceae bacterium]
MNNGLSITAPLARWQGERGTYHLLVITGAPAEALAMHARLRRLEYGGRRGFGSIKVMARIGGTTWSSSVFPQNKSPRSSSEAVAHHKCEWILLVSRNVMRAEDIAAGDAVTVHLEPL